MAAVRLLMNYFNLIDGSERDFEKEVMPAFDALMHPELKVITDKDELSKDDWKKAIIASLSRRACMEVLQLKNDPEKAMLLWTVQITFGDSGETMMLQDTKGFFKDGQLVRIEPGNPEHYTKIAKIANQAA